METSRILPGVVACVCFNGKECSWKLAYQEGITSIVLDGKTYELAEYATIEELVALINEIIEIDYPLAGLAYADGTDILYTGYANEIGFYAGVEEVTFAKVCEKTKQCEFSINVVELPTDGTEVVITDADGTSTTVTLGTLPDGYSYTVTELTGTYGIAGYEVKIISPKFTDTITIDGKEVGFCNCFDRYVFEESKGK